VRLGEIRTNDGKHLRITEVLIFTARKMKAIRKGLKNQHFSFYDKTLKKTFKKSFNCLFRNETNKIGMNDGMFLFETWIALFLLCVIKHTATHIIKTDGTRR